LSTKQIFKHNTNSCILYEHQRSVTGKNNSEKNKCKFDNLIRNFYF